MVLDKVYVLALRFREVGFRDLLGPSWGSRQYTDSDLEASLAQNTRLAMYRIP